MNIPIKTVMKDSFKQKTIVQMIQRDICFYVKLEFVSADSVFPCHIALE